MIGRILLSLSICLGINFSQPAQANDLLNWLTNYVADRPNTNRFLIQQTTFRHNVDLGISNNSNEISAGLSSGRLTFDEASDLDAQLAHIIAMRKAFMKDGAYSESEAHSIVNAMTRMNNLIATASTNTRVAMPGESFRGSYRAYNQDIAGLQASVRSRISRALASGRITPEEASLLRHEYNVISRDIDTHTGRNSVAANQAIRRLNTLDRKLYNTIAGSRAWWF